MIPRTQGLSDNRNSVFHNTMSKPNQSKYFYRTHLQDHVLDCSSSKYMEFQHNFGRGGLLRRGSTENEFGAGMILSSYEFEESAVRTLSDSPLIPVLVLR
jgi:hypothetical protein